MALETKVCVAGAGPAGALLALLLARGGVDVVLLEQHKTWDREFRGELMQAGSVDLLEELGLLSGAERIPHTRVDSVHLYRDGDVPLFGGTISLRNVLEGHRNPYGMLMPQALFLPWLADEAVKTGRAQVRMGVTARSLIVEEGRVRGLQCRTDEGDLEVRARLVVGCDGRYSKVRREAEALGIKTVAEAPPLDLLQMSIPREAIPNLPQGDTEDVAFWLRDHPDPGIAFLWPTYWADGTRRVLFGWMISKSTLSEMKERGFAAWRDEVVRVIPELAGPLQAMDWPDVNLLSVIVQRAEPWWRPGVIVLGDAAHTASPVGGQGLNLALVDAAVAAEALLGPLVADLGDGVLDLALARIERRRDPAVRRVMRFQANAPRFLALPGFVRHAALAVAPHVAAIAGDQLREIMSTGFFGFREGWDAV